jgi:hypothetical protein
MLLSTKRRPRNALNLAARPDGRTIAARRFKALLKTLTAEIGAPLTVLDRCMLEQACALILRSEQVQTEIVAGIAVDTGGAAALATEARRLLETLKSRARPAYEVAV